MTVQPGGPFCPLAMLKGRQKQPVSHVLLFSGTKIIYMAGALLSGDVKARVQNRY